MKPRGVNLVAGIGFTPFAALFPWLVIVISPLLTRSFFSIALLSAFYSSLFFFLAMGSSPTSDIWRIIAQEAISLTDFKIFRYVFWLLPFPKLTYPLIINFIGVFSLLWLFRNRKMNSILFILIPFAVFPLSFGASFEFLSSVCIAANTLNTRRKISILLGIFAISIHMAVLPFLLVFMLRFGNKTPLFFTSSLVFLLILGTQLSFFSGLTQYVVVKFYSYINGAWSHIDGTTELLMVGFSLCKILIAVLCTVTAVKLGRMDKRLILCLCFFFLVCLPFRTPMVRYVDFGSFLFLYLLLGFQLKKIGRQLVYFLVLLMVAKPQNYNFIKSLEQLRPFILVSPMISLNLEAEEFKKEPETDLRRWNLQN